MQMIENLPGQFLLACMAGVVLWVVLLVSVGLGRAWSLTWAWIDDCEAEGNPVNNWLAKVRGWQPAEYGGWRDKKRERHYDPILLFFPITLGGPAVVFLSIKFYPIALAVLTLVALAHVARFARRNKKLFDKHIKDPSAHK